MAKLNEKKQGIKTKNKEGSIAYKQSDYMLLASQVLTSFYNEKKFYGDNSKDILNTAKRVIQSGDEGAKFVSNLCVYARKEFNMRTISQVLSVVLANEKNGVKYTQNTIYNVCLRVDDMLNIISFQLSEYGHTIPNQMKKGIAKAFSRFDEYQFAKYKGDKKEVTLKDVMKLTHPIANSKEQNDLYNKIIKESLETPYTWEVEVSKRGNKKEVWEELIDSKRLGYMALLRNLRNIIKNDISKEHYDKICNYITNSVAISKNRQLPFRYLSAYKELQNSNLGSNNIYNALETAIDKSISNIKKIHGVSAIFSDNSGSMSDKISFKSSIKCYDIANLMLAMASQICDDCYTFIFGSDTKKVVINNKLSALQNAIQIRENLGGTNMNSTIQYLIDNNIKVDRIIIFSDNEANMQYKYNSYSYWPFSRNPYNNPKTCQQLFDEYIKKVNPNCWLHAIDLQGYGTVQFNEFDNHVNLIAGWSEKLLEFIPMVESGSESLVKKIKNYKF